MNIKQQADSIVEMFIDYSNPYQRGDLGLLEFSTRANTKNATHCAIIYCEWILEEMIKFDTLYTGKRLLELNNILTELKSRI